MEGKTKWEVKTVSAPEEWWEKVEAAKEEFGVNSRANFIRIAVDYFIENSVRLHTEDSNESN
jgi:metal-responsive CopG/Arc/MetJ family transcriptional regulator